MAQLRYSDLLDILMTRAERLGLTVEGGNADAVELELYIYQALLSITEIMELPEYLVNNTTMATTSPGQADYPVPGDYGRLIKPRVLNRRGVYIHDTVKNFDLEYIDPNSFSRHTSATNKKPEQFTVIQRTLWLYPSPDTNGGNNYTVRGLYVQRVERPDLDDEVLLRSPMAIIDESLFQLASDMNKLTQGLIATRQESLQRLMNGVV